MEHQSFFLEFWRFSFVLIVAYSGLWSHENDVYPIDVFPVRGPHCVLLPQTCESYNIAI